MQTIWCPMCGADFEETDGKTVCSVCKYAALPADATINIETGEARELISSGKVQVLDVRTMQERMTGLIPDSEIIPINELQERMQELDKSKPIITYCQHGIRSFHAAQFLKQNGFNARSLKGGIAAWGP